MATAVVYKKVGSVSVKEARQALTDLFEDNPYLERSLGIHALSVKAYPQKDNRVLRVFVVTETDVKLDQETALVEDFPENSSGKPDRLDSQHCFSGICPLPQT